MKISQTVRYINKIMLNEKYIIMTSYFCNHFSLTAYACPCSWLMSDFESLTKVKDQIFQIQSEF